MTSLKHGIERALLASGVAALAGRARRDGALILAYHNIVPTGERAVGDLSLHLAETAFAAQLDALVRSHDVVPLDDLLAGRAPRRGRPLAAITFDDAYRGAVTAGLAQVRRRGLPATVFVAPGFVGSDGFWWDQLSRDGGAVTTEDREAALTACRGDHEEVLRWAATRGYDVTPLPDHARVATERELVEAARHPGVTLASHSWSHVNLARSDPALLVPELERTLAWLRARCAPSPAIAYPYGIAGAAVERAAAEAGHTAGLYVSGGWMNGAARPFGVPRLNIPAGLSLDGFRLRLAGLFCR